MSVSLITIHVVISVIMILIVLLQVGRGAEAGAMFGGGGQAYSLRGSNTFIGKFTTSLAVAFMLTSLLLTYHTSNKAKSSVIDSISIEKTERSVPEANPPAADVSKERTEPTTPESSVPLKNVSREITEPAVSKAVPVASGKNLEKKSAVLRKEKIKIPPAKDKNSK